MLHMNTDKNFELPNDVSFNEVTFVEEVGPRGTKFGHLMERV